jgi:glycosyltransferase involved in cell wall biosynthesis
VVATSERGVPDGLAETLTVVLLTYNCAHRVATTLEQLVDLGLPVIVVDNGSTDDIEDVLAKFPDVGAALLPRNIGAAARNVGLQQATTTYVAFCDDDGWYERPGLVYAAALLDEHPRLAVVNARILVRDEERLDVISAEMAASPVPERHGIPGSVLLSFMAGAAIVRRSAYLQAGGYDERFFIGGEEETLAIKLARLDWQMRYVADVVMHHHPSVANATTLRHIGLRNTIVNAWLHRRVRSALRWTAFSLADAPKNRAFVRGLVLTARALPWIIRERSPIPHALDDDLRLLDRRRFAARRPMLTFHERLGRSAYPPPYELRTAPRRAGHLFTPSGVTRSIVRRRRGRLPGWAAIRPFIDTVAGMCAGASVTRSDRFR